jgi:signal transduction histidine kinase/ActR/RegA family two-component response regulator
MVQDETIVAERQSLADRARHLLAASWARVTPLAVFAIIGVSTLVMSLVVRSVMEDQEGRLLRERALEAGSLISSSFGSATTVLPVLGLTSQPTTAGPAEFESTAELLLGETGGTIGAAVVDPDDVTIMAAAGEGAGRGDVLGPERTALVRRAVFADGPVSSMVDAVAPRRLMFATTMPGAPDVVLYQELPLDSGAIDRAVDEPFADIDGAVYSASTAAADQLVVATTEDLPLGGSDVEQRKVDVGADTWTLAVKSKQPLVGSFANRIPWLVLAGGLLTALLVSALVAAVTRRRVYAQTLVDSRTAELRTALHEQELLEAAHRQSRESAEAANASKSEFLSRMSHELRTPLNAVLGFAQLLELDDLDEEQAESVEQILKGGRHLLGLINEVLDITRIEAGNFALSSEPVLAREVMNDVVELTRPLAARGNVHLIRETPGSDVFVLADRQRLNQVLLNLVSNAIKYNRQGGTVLLSCEATDEQSLSMKVTDTGPGIRPEQLDMLFMPFERLGAEQSDVEGTGIGLALSHRLAEAMGGTLAVKSELGQGSTFWIELPIVEGPVERYTRLNPTADDEEPTTEIVLSDDRTRKVLYIEDNLANLRLIERILEPMTDVELVTSIQGRLGLELAREHQPALVLLDLHLPDITGDEVLLRLRDDPLTASIPVVIVSADATSGHVQRLLNAGASAYLTKPIDVSELRKLLDDLPTPTSDERAPA